MKGEIHIDEAYCLGFFSPQNFTNFRKVPETPLPVELGLQVLMYPALVEKAKN